MGGQSICKAPYCETHAMFGTALGAKREYCSKHKPDDYVNVTKTPEQAHARYMAEREKKVEVWKAEGYEVFELPNGSFRRKEKSPRNLTEYKEKARSFNLDFFKSETPEMAYVLGWILGDGCVSNGRCSITLQRTDRKMLDKLCELTQNTCKILDSEVFDKRTEKTYKRSSLYWCSLGLCELLEKYKITPRKSLTAEYYQFPDHLIPHYLRGLIDSDGYISEKTRKISIAGTEMVCRGILADIKRLLPDIGGGVAKQQSNCYACNIGGIYQVQRILQWIYKDSTENTRLDRKYDTYMKIQDVPDTRGIKVSKAVIRNDGVIFKSQTEAAKASGISIGNRGSISLVCNGKMQTAGGYGWKFVV